MQPVLVLVLAGAPDPDAPRHPGLTAAERARCAAARHEVDAARHATGRLLARAALHRLLGRPVALDVAASGQPRPRDEPGAHVSISHAGALVVVAAATTPVGVDVEQDAALAPLLALPHGPATAFCPAELAALARAGHPTALATRWWTAKEAALKAAGTGLHLDPAAIDVRAAVVELPGHGTWALTDLTDRLATPGHRCALALPHATAADVVVEVGTDPQTGLPG